MIRVLLFIACVALAAFGLGWIADQPGDVAITFRGQQYDTSPLIALAGVAAVAFLFAVVFAMAGYLLRLPARLRANRRARRQTKGFDALTRGMIAASAGDLRNARRASADAAKHLGDQPLTMLLDAQTSLLAGDRAATEQTFSRMADHPETRVLGLRGLHVEARQRGDAAAAHEYAEAAHRIAPLPWAGQAVLEHHSAQQNWTRALQAVETNLAQKTIDKPTANRQRAVLKTALALALAPGQAEEALKLASEAVSLAPDLVPASTFVGRALGRRGDLRKAARLLEGAWRLGPHPDIAAVYLDIRPGDSSTDRLKRAQTLARLAPKDVESCLAVARAAIAAREFAVARESMEPLIAATPDNRPTARTCMAMAELEEAEKGPSGAVREWLARASRAPRDKAWVADGVVSDVWAPFSPVSGKLDAWIWQTPPERLTNAWEPLRDPVFAAFPEETIATTISLPPAGAHQALADLDPVNPEPLNLKGAVQTPEARSGLATRLKEAAFPMATAPDDPGPARS